MCFYLNRIRTMWIILAVSILAGGYLILDAVTNPRSNALNLLSACSTYAVVLVTLIYAITTSEQRDVMLHQLAEMQRDRRIQHLNKEIDSIVGPLYSRMEDPHIFNSLPLISKFGYDANTHELYQADYEEYVFWEDVKQNKYLVPPELIGAIDSYLEIRKHGSDPDSPEYTAATRRLHGAIGARYDQLETLLSELECD